MPAPTLVENLTDEEAPTAAEAVASQYLCTRAVSSRKADVQGAFSVTVIVTVGDASQPQQEWVVRLCNNEIDATKTAFAHSKLGSVVPPVRRAHFAFIRPCVAGIVCADRRKEELVAAYSLRFDFEVWWSASSTKVPAKAGRLSSRS